MLKACNLTALCIYRFCISELHQGSGVRSDDHHAQRTEYEQPVAMQAGGASPCPWQGQTLGRPCRPARLFSSLLPAGKIITCWVSPLQRPIYARKTITWQFRKRFRHEPRARRSTPRCPSAMPCASSEATSRPASCIARDIIILHMVPCCKSTNNHCTRAICTAQ